MPAFSAQHGGRPFDARHERAAVKKKPGDPLSLVFPVSLPGRWGLLALPGTEMRSSLGLRPMALAEVSKEADRPCYAVLSDGEELLARVWQLAGRCGLKGSAGAIAPLPVPGPEQDAGAPLVNGLLLTGPEGGFQKMLEVLALSGDPAEGRLARAWERTLAPQPPPEMPCGPGRTLRPCSVRGGGRPLVMAILNVTPDSFSDGGSFATKEAALGRARRMIDEGADVIDVGGESTRPGSAPVSLEEEAGRVLPLIEALASETKVPVSIDTTKAEVARRAVAAGAAIRNDISGMAWDPMMPALAAALDVPVVLNHVRGVPKTMQEHPSYQHVVLEVLLDLAVRVRGVRAAGVPASRIVVDPGIGFGKRVEDNVALLRHLGALDALECPILVGLSRKSFIGALTGRDVGLRRDGTVAAETIAVLAGASILRTHEPAAARDAIRIAAALAGLESSGEPSPSTPGASRVSP